MPAFNPGRERAFASTALSGITKTAKEEKVRKGKKTEQEMRYSGGDRTNGVEPGI